MLVMVLKGILHVSELKNVPVMTMVMSYSNKGALCMGFARFVTVLCCSFAKMYTNDNNYYEHILSS